MTVGIVAPYSWDETTTLAACLADHLTDHGQSVTWLSPLLPEPKINYSWDGRVRNGRRAPIKELLRTCEHVVWFCHVRDWLSAARRAGARNTWVALWHRVEEVDRRLAEHYDAIVTPAAAACSPLSELWQLPVWCVPWHPALPQQPAKSAAGFRLAVGMNRGTTRACGPLVLYALQMLLDELPELQVTLLYSKQWSRHALEVMATLERQYSRRVDVVRKPAAQERQLKVAESDCFFYPAVGDSSGYWLQEAQVLGVPAASLDISPSREIIGASSRRLISCETTTDSYGAPKPRPTLKGLVDGLREALQESTPVDVVALELARQLFQRRWHELLALPTMPSAAD